MTIRSRTGLATLTMAMGLLAVSSNALADTFWFKSSGAPLYSASNRTGASRGGGSFEPPPALEESGFGFDYRGSIGPVFWKKLFVGFGLSYSRLPLSREAGELEPSMDNVTKTLLYGPAIGFVSKGFHLIGTGLVGGKQTITDQRVALDGTVEGDFKWENQVGLGYQIDLGYAVAISRRVKVGPSLVFRKLNYKRQTYSNTAPGANPALNYTDRVFDSRAIEGSLTPLISLIFTI